MPEIMENEVMENVVENTEDKVVTIPFALTLAILTAATVGAVYTGKKVYGLLKAKVEAKKANVIEISQSGETDKSTNNDNTIKDETK